MRPDRVSPARGPGPKRANMLFGQPVTHRWSATPADRRGGRLLALELSDELAGAEGGRCSVGWSLDHPEGIGGNACRCRAARAGVRRCRPARPA